MVRKSVLLIVSTSSSVLLLPTVIVGTTKWRRHMREKRRFNLEGTAIPRQCLMQ